MKNSAPTLKVDTLGSLLYGTGYLCATKANRIITFLPLAIRDALDEYGDLRFEDEKARLDNFAIQVLNMPDSMGQLIGYAGQRTFPREMGLTLKRAKDYLVNVRHVQANRIISMDCGHRTDLSIRLWIVPKGATALPCDSAGLNPTNQIDFTKPRPKISRHPR